MSNLLHIPGARFVMTEQRCGITVAPSPSKFRLPTAPEYPADVFNLQSRKLYIHAAPLIVRNAVRLPKWKWNGVCNVSGGCVLFLLSLGSCSLDTSKSVYFNYFMKQCSPWLPPPSLLNTNENLGWQGETKKACTCREKLLNREPWIFEAKKSLRFPFPHLSTFLIYFLLFDWQLDKHTNVYLVRMKVTKSEASQFNGEQLRTISCLFHWREKRTDNTLFVSWKRAKEKRGGRKEREETAQYPSFPSLILSPKINSKIENQRKLCKIYLFNFSCVP